MGPAPLPRCGERGVRQNVEEHYLAVMGTLVVLQDLAIVELRDVEETGYRRSPEQRVCLITIDARTQVAQGDGFTFTERVAYQITRAPDGRFNLFVAIADTPSEPI